MKLRCRLFGCCTEIVHSDWTTIEGVVVPLCIRVQCDRCGRSIWDYNRTLTQEVCPNMLEKMTKLLESDAITKEQFRRWFEWWSKPHGYFASNFNADEFRKKWERLYR